MKNFGRTGYDGSLDVSILLNSIKRNQTHSQMAYMYFDFLKIMPEAPMVFKYRDPLNPYDLVPVNLDQPVFGKKYEQHSLISTILTQISRYSKSRNRVLDAEWAAFEGSLRELFKNRFLKKNGIVYMSNEMLAKHINPVIRKFVQSGAVFKDLDIFLADKVETFTVRFFLKEIVKVVLSKTSDADKVGQGISAWSKTLNAVFCPVFRAVEECFVASLKNHVIYENGMKEAAFNHKVASLFNSFLKKFVSDFKEFDGNQDAATQFLEDIVISIFFENELTLIYREMRLSAKQKSAVSTLIKECLKDSGESATLFTNTIINMFNNALTTEVEGVALEGYKGDDAVINASEIRLVNNLYRLSKNLHLPMVADIDFPIHADFVGYFLSEHGIIPDLLKLLAKFMSKDFVKNKNKKIGIWERTRLGVSDLPYFDQVKISLADKLKFMTHEKMLYLERVYSDLYNMKSDAFERVISTYIWFCSDDCKEFPFVPYSSLYYGEPGYERDDLTEAEKNQKRVKTVYGNTQIKI